MKITASYLNNNQFGHDVSRSLSKRKRASKNFRTINNTSSVDLAFTEGTFSLKCTHFHLLPLASLCRVELKRLMMLSRGYLIEFLKCLCITSSLLCVKKFYKWIISEILSHESKGLLRPIFIFLASNVNFLSPHGDNQMKQEDEEILLIKWCICS